MSITSTLFPPAYREAALVAFLRTFWQTIRPPIVLGSLGLGTIAATGAMHIDLKFVGIVAAASVLFAIVSGVLAAGDILKNGLPNAYVNAAAATIPASVASSPQPVTPTSPSAPAAGVPPAPAPVIQDVVPTVVAPSIAVTPTPAVPFVVTAAGVDPAAAATQAAQPVTATL